MPKTKLEIVSDLFTYYKGAPNQLRAVKRLGEILSDQEVAELLILYRGVPMDGESNGIELSIKSLLNGGTNSFVAKVVGYSEGTRTIDGNFTDAYDGHLDPGNGRKNLGSFSFQGAALSPADADVRQINKLTNIFLPAFLSAAKTKGWTKNILLMFLIGCDLYVQSEMAAMSPPCYLETAEDTSDLTVQAKARIAGYYNSNGQLDAPGFNNDINIVIEDQTRRVNAVAAAAKQYRLV